MSDLNPALGAAVTTVTIKEERLILAHDSEGQFLVLGSVASGPVSR